MKTKLLLSLPILAAMTMAASAQWSDNFQSYAVNSIITGQGGWEGWDGSAANAFITDAHPKFAGDKAASLTANDDLVHQYSGYTSGQWWFSAMQFIPAQHSGTVTYFIMMNKYTVPSKGWSVQMKFDYGTGKVTDDESATKPGVPIVYNAWTPIKVLIDLDANTQTTFYNGVQVGTADWYDPTSVDHLKSIAALDLWADSGGGGVCYDDISLTVVPEPGTVALLTLGALGFVLRRRS